MSFEANADRNTGARRIFASLLQSPLTLPLVGLVVVSTLMAFASANFFSLDNLLNVLRQVSIVGILAVGMTFVILTGGIDLSVGAVMALVGTISAGLIVNSGLPGELALALGLGLGLLIGLFNGVLVAWGRMPSIIVTLATMGMARGSALSIQPATRSAAFQAGCPGLEWVASASFRRPSSS